MNPSALSLAGTPSFNTQGNVPIAPPPDPTTGQGSGQGFLNFILPTGGAVLGDLVGGPIGGAAGAAGGQALSDLLSGKRPGGDVLLTGALTGAGGAVAKGASSILGKVLGNAGEDFATGGLNLTKSTLNKLTQQNGESVAQTILKNNLAGADAGALDSKLSNLYQFHGNITQDIPMDYNTFAQHADDALGALRDSPVASNKELYNQVNENVQNILDQMGQGKFNLNKALGEYDAATKNAQFGSSPWGANRYTGDILRKTMYDIGDNLGVTGPNGESLKEFGLNLRNLQNVTDAAAKREGMGENAFGLPNIFRAELGGRVAETFGANPFLGTLFPGARIATNLLKQSPAAAGVLSKVLSAGAAGVAKAAPLTELGGAFMGANIGSQGIPKLVGVGGQGAGVGSNNVISSGFGGAPGVSALTSLLGNGGATSGGIGVGQQGQEQIGNQGDNSNNHGAMIAQSNSSVNSQSQLPSFSGNGAFPAQLPAPSQISNTIPGQLYPPDQQAQDLAQINAEAAKYAGNPLGMQLVQQHMQIYQEKKALNDQQANLYVSQHGLNGDQKQFVETAPTTYNQMNELRGLIMQQGGTNLFQSVLNDNPAIQYVKANTDPTGQYARMLTLMKQMSGNAARAIQGGRPSNLDLQLYSAFQPGQTMAANLANLDQAQSTLLNQYQLYAPLYGLSLQGQPGGGGGGGTYTGNQTLDSIISAGQ